MVGDWRLDMAHASLSPSSAHRWTKCSAAPEYEARFPSTQSDAADEGTFAHSIAERCLRENTVPASYLGETSECGRFTVDEDMASAVLQFVDLVRDYEDFTGTAALIEQQVELTAEVWGTADALLVSSDGKHLYVFDYKHGAGVFVEAKGNVQLLTYAAAALATMPEPDLVEHVTVAIVQPRYPSESPVRYITHTRAEIDIFTEQLLAAAMRTKVAPEFVPGDHCRWCRGKAECAALRNQSLVAAKEAFADTPIAPEELSDERVAELLHVFPQVRDWMSALETHALRRAQSGKSLPGHKLVAKVGLRKWNDEAEAESVLRQAGVDPFGPPKLVSPAQAEKALQKHGVALKQAKAVVAQFAHKPQTGIALVPTSDRRPELMLPTFTQLNDKNDD